MRGTAFLAFRMHRQDHDRLHGHWRGHPARHRQKEELRPKGGGKRLSVWNIRLRHSSSSCIVYRAKKHGTAMIVEKRSLALAENPHINLLFGFDPYAS